MRAFCSLLLSAVAALSAAGATPQVTEAMRIFNEIQVTNRVTNLRNNAWLDRNYRAALKVATNANERARIAYAYAKFGYDSAVDDDFAKWRQAQRDAYATPGADAAVRLDLLKRGVAGLDYEKDGWSLVEREPKLQPVYFRELLDRTRFGTVGIEEAGSAEHRLAVCDKAIGLLGEDALGGWFVTVKATTLRRLGRDADAEALLLGRVASTEGNPRARYQAQTALAEFYRDLAQRYYAEPDADILRLALASAEGAIVTMRLFDERPNAYAPAVETAFRLKDYAKVESLLADYRRLLERRKLPFPDASFATWAGDLAYCRGDYEGAVRAYSSVKELPRPQAAESHYNRYLGALYATGRYEEALAVVPKLIGWASLADRNALYRRILKAKAALRR